MTTGRRGFRYRETVPCPWCKARLVYRGRPMVCSTCLRPTGLQEYRTGSVVRTAVRDTMTILVDTGEKLVQYAEANGWGFTCLMSPSRFNAFIDMFIKTCAPESYSITSFGLEVDHASPTRLLYRVHVRVKPGTQPFVMPGVEWRNPAIWCVS